MTQTEHPERERLAKELWWSLCRDWSFPQIDRLWPQLSAEGLNANVYEIADRLLALLRPEAASPPVVVTESRSGEVLHRSFEVASPPEGREPITFRLDETPSLVVLRTLRADAVATFEAFHDAGIAARLEFRNQWWRVSYPMPDAERAREVLHSGKARAGGNRSISGSAPAAPVDRGLVERRRTWEGVVHIAGAEVEGKTLEEALRDYADEYNEHVEPYEGAGYCVCRFCQVFAPMAAALERAPAPLSEPIVRWGDHEYRDGQWHPPLERAPEARAGEVTNEG